MEKQCYKTDGKRLMALDAARGLAVAGMYVQHFALHARTGFVSGNTMILFMLCSGASFTLMARSMSGKGIKKEAFRARVLARSFFIDLAGYFLLMLNGPFAVVLSAYAMLFLIGLLLVRCPDRMLLLISAVSFVFCPPLMLAGLSLLEGAALLQDIAGGPLSALAWLPVFAAGMAVGRFNLTDTQTKFRLLAAGAAILIPTKLFSVFWLPGLYRSFNNWLAQFADVLYAEPDPYAVWPLNTSAPPWQMLLIDSPQGGSAFELLIGTGGCLILLGILLLLEVGFRTVLRPFAGTGKVSLTLYALQFVLAWFLSLCGIDPTAVGSGFLGDFITAAAVIGLGWLISLLPCGPLERGIRTFEALFYRP